ncbi:hypothetical protein Aduo_016039 [Ancylostoma duodenale]
MQEAPPFVPPPKRRRIDRSLSGLSASLPPLPHPVPDNVREEVRSPTSPNGSGSTIDAFEDAEGAPRLADSTSNTDGNDNEAQPSDTKNRERQPSDISTFH